MKSFLQLVLVVLVIAICLGLAGGVLLADRLPRKAKEKFGPPSPSLSLRQRVVYSYRLLANEEALNAPLDVQQVEPYPFQIETGESVNTISFRLEQEHFITNADSFRTYLVYAGLDTRVQAGVFLLSPAMTPLEIAHKLMDAVPEEVEFVILPGWRAEEIAAALPTSGLQIEQAEFLELVRNPPAEIFPPGLPPASSLEGMMMPGSYQVLRKISAADLAALFLARFDETVSQEWRDGFSAQGLDLAQAVVLASIIEREAMVPDEQPMIASVFYNRLAQGMKLESDPTVQYALGYQLVEKTWWKNPLSSADLQVNSLYNTYVSPGLPPGPIANPAPGALQAVAFPEQSGFYYFRARCDGSGRHFFAVTYEEHLQNACP